MQTLTADERPATASSVFRAASPDTQLVSFDTTVPRVLVHRRAVAEVLLTDWHALGGSTYVCGAQLPRAHSFYAPCSGRYDPLLFAEALRQAGTLLAHADFGVSEHVHFLMDRLHIEVTGNTVVSERPCDLELVVQVHDVVRPGSRMQGFTLTAQFYRDGVVVASGTGSVRFIPPGLYPRLRWGSSRRPAPGPAVCPPPVEPATVGAHDLHDVVLGKSDTPDLWPLRVRTDHPVLFDHPLDHVPGMLLLEAFRQAARLRVGWPASQLVASDAHFSKYVELDEPCQLNAELIGRDETTATLAVRAYQRDHIAARAEITLARINH